MSKSRWHSWIAVGVLALAIPAGSTAASLSPGLALVQAAHDNDASAVSRLLDQKVPVNVAEGDGATALAWAASNGNSTLVTRLLAAGADPNIVNDYGVGPLLLAVRNGNLEITQALLKGGAKPNLANWTKETPLMHAARVGNPQIVRALLQSGAEVDARESRDNQTALMWAAAAGNADVVRILLEAKANRALVTPTVEVDYGFRRGAAGGRTPRGAFTALHFATSSWNVETVKILLDAGDDPNTAAADGTTPLILALYHHLDREEFPRDSEIVADVKMVKLLLDRGADPNKADANGFTPLAAAAFVAFGHDRRGSLTDVPTVIWPHDEQAEEVAKMLLARGADPNIKIVSYVPPIPAGADARGGATYANVSPFLLAAAFGKAGLVQLMADSGRVDAKSRTKDGSTLLMQVIRMNSVAAARALIGAGADVKAADNAGNTALHIAAAGGPGTGPIVEALLQAGASLDAKNAAGQSALDLAKVVPSARGGGPGGRRGPPPPDDNANGDASAGPPPAAAGAGAAGGGRGGRGGGGGGNAADAPVVQVKGVPAPAEPGPTGREVILAKAGLEVPVSAAQGSGRGGARVPPPVSGPYGASAPRKGSLPKQ